MINNEAPTVFVHYRGLFFVCLRPSQGEDNLNFYIQYTLVLLILNPATYSPLAG